MTTICMADLIGSRVVDGAGSRRGKVVDVVISEEGHYQLLELVIGARGWIERLNMANALLPHDSGSHQDRIGWKQVDRFDHGTIYLKDAVPKHP
jgi:sporulation protein YlmC with PRC-barrel domain